MRKWFIPLALGVLCWAPCGYAQSQDPAQNGSQPASKSATTSGSPSQPQQQADASSSDQPLSLAEMARLARAKRQTDGRPAAKTSRVLDDDNMPRGVYASDAPPVSHANPGSRGSGAQTAGAAGSGSPFP